ncbi:hypothetical protein [Lunatimonas lonarensis]|nr:hypothetical protein [Lunatimonas lonarensis]
MKELSIERMAEIQGGGFREPDPRCVISTGLKMAVAGGVMGAFAVGFAFAPGVLGGWVAGVVIGLVECSYIS